MNEKTKHIAVSESTKKRFDALKKAKGMSQDGLISFMIELTERLKK